MPRFTVCRAGATAWYVLDTQAKAPAEPTVTFPDGSKTGTDYPSQEQAENARLRLDLNVRLQRLYQLSNTADDAYQAELEHVYGPAEATAARYDRTRNAATLTLDLLRTVKVNADAARHAASDQLLTDEFGAERQLAATYTDA